MYTTNIPFIWGVEDPKELSLMAIGKLKNKQDQLSKSLRGLVGSHQKMILSAMLVVDYFEQHKKQHIVKRSIKRLESLGYRVSIEETQANIA